MDSLEDKLTEQTKATLDLENILMEKERLDTVLEEREEELQKVKPELLRLKMDVEKYTQ